MGYCSTDVRTHLELGELEPTRQHCSAQLQSETEHERDSHACTAAAEEGHPVPSQISILISRFLEMMNVQVRVDTWDLRFREILRKGRQPALRLPLLRVLAPQSLVLVGRKETDDDGSIFGNGNLVYHLAVNSSDGLREGKHSVLTSPTTRRDLLVHASARRSSRLTLGIIVRQVRGYGEM